MPTSNAQFSSLLPGPDHFPRASEIAFSSFNGMYTGQTCYVIGRGPTEFDYRRLADIRDPVFFINDAVCLEKYAVSETYFFAHDPQMLVWLNGTLKSTVVIPVDGKIFRHNPDLQLKHTGAVVYYHWQEGPDEAVLRMTRDQLAQTRRLFTHTGTIHSLLHFLWFCGFAEINLVGCDCMSDSQVLDPSFHTPDGYDSRLDNRSGSHCARSYDEIGRAQQLLIQLFGFEAIYHGTPVKRVGIS